MENGNSQNRQDFHLTLSNQSANFEKILL